MVDVRSDTPDEVELVWETMTCRGSRGYYDKKFINKKPIEDHPCAFYFNLFGPLYTYDINDEKETEEIEEEIYWTGEVQKRPKRVEEIYVGERYLVPELLSGCRKAPIMSIGLNPNLRAVTIDRKKKWDEAGKIKPAQKRRIYPYFDDITQYARHFRFRTKYKRRIAEDYWKEHVPKDDLDTKVGDPIKLSQTVVSMYKEYEEILKAFQEKIRRPGGKLSLGEDVSYYNFVSCHSPRWAFPDEKIKEGIVDECFHRRNFFPTQLIQSMPKVVIIFGQNSGQEFINFVKRFDKGGFVGPVPKLPTFKEMYKKKEKYYVKIEKGGKEHQIRVIFSVHPTGNRYLYGKTKSRARIVRALYEEFRKGNLIYDRYNKHLKRTPGSCRFCYNDLFFIQPCRYHGPDPLRHFEEYDTRDLSVIKAEDREAVKGIIGRPMCRDCEFYKPIDKTKGECFGQEVPADMDALDECPRGAFKQVKTLGGERMIKEVSRIRIKKGGKEIDYKPRSVTDAMERAVNLVLKEGGKVEIVQTIEVSSR